jgi:hypothetical protein
MRRSEALPALGCAAAVAVAFFLTWPFAEIPFNDDWSYAFTARQLAQTGRLIYNGWSAPAIIPQTYWGAFIIRIFGFSFTALRISTLPLAMISSAICYLLARRCGLSRNSAVFAALTLALGPLFLPLSTSFMTDIPGLMFMLLSLYALIRCAQSTTPFKQQSWLAAGTLIAILGGMNRQVVWIVPLAIVPYLVILRRQNTRFLIAATSAWVLVLASAIATTQWFNSQPYTILDLTLDKSLSLILQEPSRLWQTLLALWLTTAMFALPAMLPAGFAAARHLLTHSKIPRILAPIVTVSLILIFLLRFPRFLEMPWLANMLTPQGILGKVEIIGHRPTILPRLLRQIIGAIVWAVTAAIAADFLASLPLSRASAARFRGRIAQIPSPVICMVILAAVYTAALLSRVGRDLVFDRYALPLIPVCTILALIAWQNASISTRVRQMSWKISLAVLGIFALFAVASTQEVFALGRARVEALTTLRAAGVPPTQVEDGIEELGWTQLEVAGHINNPEIRNPRRAYERGKGFAPTVAARFEVEASPDTRSSAVFAGDVEYFSILPPFHRRIYIYRGPPQENWP